ncbi:hypothetical protein [Streptomyces sp. NPDC059411]|uniref:hypothetical protein n=1 Tax=Streptomyces sp. NPDC059411 TaxID=3346825 RepID=UPI00369F46BE
MTGRSARRRAVLGQLSLDDIPQATGNELTGQDKHRAAELLAQHRAHQAARQWHRFAADFFGGTA